MRWGYKVWWVPTWIGTLHAIDTAKENPSVMCREGKRRWMDDGMVRMKEPCVSVTGRQINQGEVIIDLSLHSDERRFKEMMEALQIGNRRKEKHRENAATTG